MRSLPREAGWGVGIGFIIGMVILLILAIQAFQGPTSVVLLVVAGVFLLVGLYFLTGPPEAASAGPAPAAPPATPLMAAPGQAPTASLVPPASVSTTPPPAPRVANALIVCPGCRNRVGASFRRCPHCGTVL